MSSHQNAIGNSNDSNISIVMILAKYVNKKAQKTEIIYDDVMNNKTKNNNNRSRMTTDCDD